jgi:hypothetical protein
MITSITVASSIAIRLRCLTAVIRDLGDRPLYELLAELVAVSSATMDRVEAYASINPDILDRFGGRDLPPVIRLVKSAESV